MVAVLILFSRVAFATQLTDSSKSNEYSESIIGELSQYSGETIEIELDKDIYVENDGGFVGIGLGYSMIAWQSYNDRYNKDVTPNYTKSLRNKNIFGVSYGLTLGYKHFFNEYIGARYYVSFGANYGALKQDGFSRIDLIDYSANVDFLANVYTNETLSFGLFLGLGIGGNTIVGKYVSDTKRNLRNIVVNDTNLSSKGINIKTHTTHFDFAINAGFRLNIGANHGVELVARMPLLPKSVYNYAFTTIGKVSDTVETLETKYSTSLYNEVKPNHSIMIRYVFSF